SYPYYLGWEFAPYERGHRINQLLTGADKQTVDHVIAMQNDNYSVLARDLLPILLRSLASVNELTPIETSALERLQTWNLRYDVGEIAATIFEKWYYTLQHKIWSDEFSGKDILMRFPGR